MRCVFFESQIISFIFDNEQMKKYFPQLKEDFKNEKEKLFKFLL